MHVDINWVIWVILCTCVYLFYSEETIKRLLDNMFETDEPPDWVIVNGTYVLLTALEKK